MALHCYLPGRHQANDQHPEDSSSDKHRFALPYAYNAIAVTGILKAKKIEGARNMLSNKHDLDFLHLTWNSAYRGGPSWTVLPEVIGYSELG